MKAPVQASDRLPHPDEKGMLSDIYDTPEALRETLRQYLKAGKVELPGLNTPLPEGHSMAGKTPMEVMAKCSTADGNFSNRFTIIGCGTSHHAALVAEYLIEHIARIPVEVQYASEYRYRQPVSRPGDVFIVVSNSGATTDSVESMRLLRRSDSGKDVLTVGVVNEAESTIGKEADVCIQSLAGAEAGVASTKVFSCTVLSFVLLAIALGEAAGTFKDAERKALLEKLEEIPSLVQGVIDTESRPLKKDSTQSLEIGECILWDMSCQNVLAQNFIYLGRGCNFPIALEGAMKCKEMAYIHAEGYPAAEMKHGPIALIDQFMPVVVIAPQSDPCYDKIKANINEVATRSGCVIAITDSPADDMRDLCEYIIRVPSTHELLMPLITVIPMQLLAYMMGVLKGNEVDRPRGLRKSISVPV
mmetsp:Transcript_44811/g.115986  ORF Transcript_44811/g.115986 Transcript_44811/m.115986 type:complete len:417 (+) Transcript_44811:131-1381(+)